MKLVILAKITAPANDQRAIGVVEQLMQPIKRRLSCMKNDSNHNVFTIKELIKSIVYHLGKCKQKSSSLSPFQVHFGRKAKTPLSNNSTVPNCTNFTYGKVLKYFFDAVIIPVDDSLDKNGWLSTDRSDVQIEETITWTELDAASHSSRETQASHSTVDSRCKSICPINLNSNCNTVIQIPGYSIPVEHHRHYWSQERFNKIALGNYAFLQAF